MQSSKYQYCKASSTWELGTNVVGCEGTGNERPCFFQVDFTISAGDQPILLSFFGFAHFGNRVAKEDSSVKVPD